MAEHTPGPWRIEHTGIPASDWQIVVTVGDDPWRFVASVHGDPESSGMPGPEADRNAHLIASAPDLLAALVEMVNEAEMLLALWSEGDPLAIDPGHRERMDRALAVIAKATNEEPR